MAIFALSKGLSWTCMKDRLLTGTSSQVTWYTWKKTAAGKSLILESQLLKRISISLKITVFVVHTSMRHHRFRNRLLRVKKVVVLKCLSKLTIYIHWALHSSAWRSFSFLISTWKLLNNCWFQMVLIPTNSPI